jgi:hypothetical protein
MDLNLPLNAGISLRLADKLSGSDSYPTSRLCKGLILVHDGQDLDEEGVGFGVPVIKLGLRTIFSGEVALQVGQSASRHEIEATFRMNLEEKLGRPEGKRVDSKALYAAKNMLAGFNRAFPPLRRVLTRLSNDLRRLFAWETTYEAAGHFGVVSVTYTVDPASGVVEIEVDTAGLLDAAASEVVVMNEQGAHYFDEYRDSNGLRLRGDELGSWDEVSAQQASFVCQSRGLGFSLHQVPGARLLRGRELIGSRLAWAGFGYSFPPRLGGIHYQVKIEVHP